MIYSGTVAHRHSEAIDRGIEPIRDALTAAGIENDWEDCNGYGTNPGQCQHPDKNPRIFTEENLAQYDALFFFNAGGDIGGSGAQGPLWVESDRDAIRGFVNAGGGIAANHLATDIGAGAVSWDWWDGMGDSAVGSTMPGHPPSPQTANIRVSDRNHVASKDLPEEFAIADEFYMFHRSVRGTHHVLATLDENTPGFDPGQHAMGQDHPVAWCRDYDGGRIFATSLGHYGDLYQPVEGEPSNLVKLLVGGVKWVAGVAGNENDCRGTVWNNFRRTTLASDLKGAVSLDVASDGRVYWTEIGAPGHESSGRVRMYDPETKETTLVHTIPTRADALGASEDGVLGMSLDPDFDENNYIYVYYSPRGEGENWPNEGTGMVLGYNLISRFELNDEGTAVVDQQEILRVPKVKVAPGGDGGPEGATTNWPAHTGGAGMDFDSEGNLYVGVGDDVNPYDANRNWSPIDQRYEHRYDARNTAANTNDLRGKILRIKPKPDASGEPGLGRTYEVPAGNMFPVGTEKTKPEIYAMGFRNPYSVHADPERPGVVVVGEYGPDSGSNHPERGPAGIIEWNHITKPGFYGWPFCTGDNSVENTYFRFTYPSGPSGARFDCSLEQIPNESDYNTGLDMIPGPAIKATIWHKRDGSTPPHFGIPTGGGSQEPNSGPIYRYDPDNESETKWPAYYDGSWIAYNRSQNWWRDVKLKSDDSFLAANPFVTPSGMGPGPGAFALATRFGPDGALYLASWPGGGRGDQGANGQLMRIDYVGDTEDTEAPVVTASVDGRLGAPDRYVGSATVELTSRDTGISGTALIEYRVDGGEWQESRNPTGGDPYTATVPFGKPGVYTVEFRATDRAGNASESDSIQVVVVPGTACTWAKSDEFEGAALDERWSVRVDQGQATVADGKLVLPVLWEVDGGETGPLAFAGQQVPEGDWTMTTRVTINNTQTWQSAGLYVRQSDNNFVKFGMTYHGPGRNFELTADAPPNGERVFTSNESADGYGNTVWLRMIREGNTIRGQYARDVDGQPGPWVSHGGTQPVNTNPPREGDGVLAGVYAGGQQNGPWNLTAAFDFVHYSPDTADCIDDLDAPAVSAKINGAEPQPSYPGSADVQLSATDPSGVASLEYRVDGGEWVKRDNTGDADPFEVEVEVSGPGQRTVEYRATDKHGNVGALERLSFELRAGGETDVYADDRDGLNRWTPDSIRTSLGETVTWHFDGLANGGNASTWHNLYVVRPGDDPFTDGIQVGPAVIPVDAPPVEYTFDREGTWTFYCALHVARGETNWTGMVGTVEVGPALPDTAAPTTTATASGAKVTLSASDGTKLNASGVAYLEYAVDGGSTTRVDNAAGAEPFVHALELTGPGTHTVRFGAVDGAGNREPAKSVTVTVAAPPPPPVGDPGPVPQPAPPPPPAPAPGGGVTPSQKADLSVRAVKRTVTARKGARQVTLQVRLRNAGDATARRAKVCASLRSKRDRQRLSVPSRCRTVNVAAGKTKTVGVRVKVKRAARGKTTSVRLRVSGGGLKATNLTVKVRVRR